MRLFHDGSKHAKSISLNWHWMYVAKLICILFLIFEHVSITISTAELIMLEGSIVLLFIWQITNLIHRVIDLVSIVYYNGSDS